MPIYEYHCSDCDRPFEELVMSSATAVSCPICSSSHVERQLSVFASRSGTGSTPSPSSASSDAGGFTGGSCCGGGCGCR
ncbi:MAG TPA: zinc ribbon domain-containing protein [Candidatus Kryptonia bacterium]|nr:zinc ribbon domain-containing protein [Candidatus Kryptonia bacterium]